MNLFIRTSIAPYRVDIYNALHARLDMRMCFYYPVGHDQAFDRELLESASTFKPTYLKGIRLGRDSRKLCFGLWKLVREEDPVLVIVPEFQLVLYQLAFIRLFRRKKFRIVSMCDDSIDMIEKRNDFTGLHRFLRSWAPKMLDDIIVLSPQVRDWYREHFGIGQWMPIMMDNGAARARYERLLPQSAALEEKYALKGRKVVLFVGRLVGLKNVDKLIDAFAAMDCDAALVIVGGGLEGERLRKQAAATGKEILFTGRLEGDDLYAWYNVADVVALPSSQEAFGAVVSEALLAGARVVVSARAGAACLVTPENGAVIDIADENALREALEGQLALSEPRSGELRPDLMPYEFNTLMDDLVRQL